MLIDTHAHISYKDYSDRIDEVIQTAADNGVEKIISIGVDLSSSEECMKLARNEISFDMFYQYLSKKLDIRKDQFKKDEFVRIWSNMKFGILPINKYLLSLSKIYDLYILTNTTIKHVEQLKNKFTFISKFTGIITSDIAQSYKPDKVFFKYACKFANTQPQNVVFIDDTYENVKTAQNLNMLTHQYTNSGKLDNFIAKIL